MSDPGRTDGSPRKILLASDLSARCDRALDRAVALARTWRAPLVVVHALEQPDDFYTTNLERRLPSWRRPLDAAGLAAEQLRRDMRPAARDVTVVVEKGDPAEVIVRVVEREGCDLIVTGIARDETLGRFGLGSTFDRLLRRSIVPVLVVKQRARSPYRNIVVATDLSDSSRRALQVAMALFPDHKLGVLHAYEAPRADMMREPARHREEAYRKTAAAECAAFLAESGIPDERWRSFSILVEPGSPIDLVHQYVRDRKVDLVVLGTHGRSALFNILIGSTAKAILSSLPCDALVVREPRSAEGSRRS